MNGNEKEKNTLSFRLISQNKKTYFEKKEFQDLII
jgi:hypothetical protein